jgi:uncharacterized membrane protein (UPF0127 family)
LQKTTIFFITGLLLAAALSAYITAQPRQNQASSQTTITKATEVITDISTSKGPYVIIAGVRLSVEVADTPSKRGRGLSGREMLPENSGMLFVFDTPGRYGFWMYGMKFPLDIIWIDERLRVVYFVENAQPCVNICETHEPPADALYVLEVNAGFVKKYGLKVGDVVELSGLV